MDFPKVYDVIVVGGGHAGIEAALASARMGCQTLLLTHNIETLGEMSCNPSIGGIGKGHLVREIDAMGGAMGSAADMGGIQMRTLNDSKGPAVRSTRAQIDRNLYKIAMRGKLENQKNLDIFQEAADDLILEADTVKGVVSKTGVRFFSTSVVLSAGTFLHGLIHIGLQHYQAGRMGDPASISLAEKLIEIGMPMEARYASPYRWKDDQFREVRASGRNGGQGSLFLLGSVRGSSRTGSLLDHQNQSPRS